jgi:hypothetical protein
MVCPEGWMITFENIKFDLAMITSLSGRKTYEHFPLFGVCRL